MLNELRLSDVLPAAWTHDGVIVAPDGTQLYFKSLIGRPMANRAPQRMKSAFLPSVRIVNTLCMQRVPVGSAACASMVMISIPVTKL